MPDEVEEEVALRHGNNLVGNFDEKGEALGTFEVESVGYGGAEVLRSSRRVYLESLVGVVREVHLREGRGGDRHRLLFAILMLKPRL